MLLGVIFGNIAPSPMLNFSAKQGQDYPAKDRLWGRNFVGDFGGH